MRSTPLNVKEEFFEIVLNKKSNFGPGFFCQDQPSFEFSYIVSFIILGPKVYIMAYKQ